MMTTPGAATDAIRLAHQANDRLDGHEQLCSDRWSELRKEVSAIKKQQWAFVGLLLVAQGALIGFLVQRLP